jgi:hypothetical protein
MFSKVQYSDLSEGETDLPHNSTASLPTRLSEIMFLTLRLERCAGQENKA